jgi:hypothetical protein
LFTSWYFKFDSSCVFSGGEDAAVWVNVNAHDVHPSSSSQRNIERNSTAVCLAIDGPTISVPAIDNSEKQHRDQTEGVYVDSTSVANINGLTNQSNVTLSGKEVHAREEDLLHSVGDREQGFDSGDKQMGTREEILGELDALDDLSQEKDRKKARVAGSFDTSAVDPIRETNDSTTRDVETNTNSRGMLSNTSFQQEVDGNVKEDSVQLENPIIPEKNKKRKKSKLVTSKDVSAREMTEPSTGAVEQSKAIGINTPGFLYNTILFLSTVVSLELSSCEWGIFFLIEFGHEDFKNILDFIKYVFRVETMPLVHVLDECNFLFL